MNCNSGQNAPKSKEYWLKHGNISVPPFRVSVIGGLVNNVSPEPEAFDKILAIVKERLEMEPHTLVSAAIRKEDFLPIYFLETGVKQSLAVCRIARYFSIEIFREFIEELETAIKQLGNVNNNFDTPDKVIEVFSIPEQVANELFNQEDKSKNTHQLKTPLGVLKDITERQLAKVNPIPIGTGFLVGGTHLLTNHHVVPDEKTAEQCVAQFNFVENDRGERQKSSDYEFAPRILFISEPSLDYTLVQLKSGMFTRQAGYEFGWLQLIEDYECLKPSLTCIEISGTPDTITAALQSGQKIIKTLEVNGYIITPKNNCIQIWHPQERFDEVDLELKQLAQLMGDEDVSASPKRVTDTKYKKKKIGDSVIVVQHPKGRQKQIVLNENGVTGLYKDFVRYQSDSDYGSSGSPVFNTRWQLTALHHAVITKEVPENPYQQTNSDSSVEQQGIRTCRIIENLKKQSVSNSKLASFIEDFVVTSEQLNFPPLPSGLEFDGQSSYVDIGVHKSLDITDAITVEAWVRRKPDSGDGIIISRNGAYSLYWLQGRIWVHLQQSSEKSEKFSLIEGVALNDSLWHHIAFAWGRESKDIQIFLDGIRQDNKNWEKNWDSNKYIEKSKESLKIGTDLIEERINYFSGYIAEVRLWKLARTAAQIRADMYRRLHQDDKNGLIGYWRFEDGENYKVCNLAKSDPYNLSDINLYIKDSPMQPQFGLHLNSSSCDYIDCGSYESLEIEEAITLEAWFKYEYVTEVSLEGEIKKIFLNGIIVNRGGAWVENGYSLFFYNENIRVELQNIEQKTVVDTINPVPDIDLWYHVAFTWDKESKTIQIYVDGVKQETTFGENSKLFEGPISKPRLNLNIGRAQDYGFYFNGSIAEVRLWKIALTEEHIKENMTRPLQGKEPGLVGLWRLDEEEGDRAANLVSESDTGIVYGGRWLKPYSILAANQSAYGVVFRTKWLRASQYPHAAPPLPFGLKFNQEKAYIDCGNGEGLDTPAAITVEAWVKHKFGNCVIVSRGGIVKPDGNLEKGYSLAWYDGKIRVTLSDGTSEKTIVYSKENAPADRIWHHIAFTWDKESKEIAIYIDGRCQNSVVKGKSNTILFQGQSESIGLFAGSINNSAANLIIGLKEAKETYYSVAIAEVRLWNVCRAQDRIKADMSRRLKGKEDGLVGYWRLDDGGESNNQVRNLVSDKNHGTIYEATWWNPVREITDTGNKGDSTDNPPETPPSNQTS